MGCNCGGSSFQIDDGMVAADAPVVGDPNYFWTGKQGVTSANAEGALVAPDGAKVWNADTGRTEE